MRTSKKAKLLEAAVALVEADGLAALTYDSLAAATGVTKSGLIYHFPSRTALLLNVTRHVAARWVMRLEEVAGGSANEVTLRDRLRAVVVVHNELASRADLILTIDSVVHPELSQVWREALDPWLIAPDDASESAFLVQLAANGLWTHDHVSVRPMTEQERARATEQVLALIDAAVS